MTQGSESGAAHALEIGTLVILRCCAHGLGQMICTTCARQHCSKVEGSRVLRVPLFCKYPYSRPPALSQTGDESYHPRAAVHAIEKATGTMPVRRRRKTLCAGYPRCAPTMLHAPAAESECRTCTIGLHSRADERPRDAADSMPTRDCTACAACAWLGLAWPGLAWLGLAWLGRTLSHGAADPAMRVADAWSASRHSMDLPRFVRGTLRAVGL
jgi:hypothetical protein